MLMFVSRLRKLEQLHSQLIRIEPASSLKTSSEHNDDGGGGDGDDGENVSDDDEMMSSSGGKEGSKGVAERGEEIPRDTTKSTSERECHNKEGGRKRRKEVG